MKAASANILFKALDDDPEELEIIKEVCDEYNVEKYQLHTDEEAFFKNMNADVNLCLVDHGLGATTGLGITQRIKKMNVDNYVIVSSGIQDFKVAVAYLKAGADNWVEKGPIDTYKPELITALREGFAIAKDRIEKERRLKLLEHDTLKSMSEISKMLEVLNNPKNPKRTDGTDTR